MAVMESLALVKKNVQRDVISQNACSMQDQAMLMVFPFVVGTRITHFAGYAREIRSISSNWRIIVGCIEKRVGIIGTLT